MTSVGWVRKWIAFSVISVRLYASYCPGGNVRSFHLGPTAAQTGNPSIVGLWRVHYFENGAQVFQSFDQWHGDGQKFEVANIFGLSCQGVFRQRQDGSVQLFHVGWNYDANGNLTGYFEETQIDKVSADSQHYTGTWDIKNFDVNGKFLSEDKGTLRAIRLNVH